MRPVRVHLSALLPGVSPRSRLQPFALRGLATVVAPALLMHAATTASAGPASPPRHVVAVEIDPDGSRLHATDSLTLPWVRSLELGTGGDLEIVATCEGRPLTLEPTHAAGRVAVKLPSACRDREGRATLELTTTGARTPRIPIFARGAVLPAGAGWYAETDEPALFDVSVTVPAAWSAIAQGAASGMQAREDGRRTFRYVTSRPSPGVAIAAGPYATTVREASGVAIAAWLLDGSTTDADAVLDAAQGLVERLVERLGPHPAGRVAIVESPASHGARFPGGALIAGRTARTRDAGALREVLGPELARAWLGHHVMPDAGADDWSEGLASYAAEEPGDVEALRARQELCLRYSVDAPLSQGDTVPASARRARVALVAHVLERELGEDVVTAALRDLVERFGGRRATWTDVRACLERASGADLDAFFAQWVERPGLPRLALADVRDEGGRITGRVVQEGAPYELALDVEVTTTDGGTVSRRLAVAGTSTPFQIDVPGPAHRVRLDPGFDVPRHLSPRDQPPCLARTLAARDLIVIVPDEPGPNSGAGSEQWYASLVDLATQAAGARGRVMTNKQAARVEVEGSSVLLIGSVRDNGWLGELADHLEATTGVDVRGRVSLRAGNRRLRSPAASLLVTAPHPRLADATVSAWMPLGFESLEGGPVIFDAAWDTWVAIESGRPTSRGTAWPGTSATSVVVADRAAPRTPAARMRATVDALCAPVMEGREAGANATRAGRWLADQLAAAGLQAYGERTWEFPFGFTLQDLPGTPSLALRPQGVESPIFVPVVPATGWLPAPTMGVAAAELGLAEAPRRLPVVHRIPRGLVYVGGPEAPRFSGLDLADAAAVVRDDASPGAHDRILRWMDEARRRNAEALVVLRPDAAWPGERDLVVCATQRSPEDAPRLAALEATAGFRAVERDVARRRASLPPLPRHRTFPLFFAGPEMAAALDRAEGLIPGVRSFADQGADLRLSVGMEVVHDVNVLGLVPGTSGRMDRAVLVSAHHDALGEALDGAFQEGAADNAAGVAVVLEVAARLAERPATLPVAIVFLSGTEWGLQGSRVLVENWTGQRPDLAAVVNVDAVGRPDAPMRVVGRDRAPGVAAVLEGAAEASGLAVVRDPDVRGGGASAPDMVARDHEPWVGKGAPAVSITQADAAWVGGPRDTTDGLDADALERLADALEAAVRRLADGT